MSSELPPSVGELPFPRLAPLEYRFALDAAMPALASRSPSAVLCDAAALADEVGQRVAGTSEVRGARSVLWVEPAAPTWRTTLERVAVEARPDTLLVVIASLPLARLLPERRGWSGQPLGYRIAGLGALRSALRRSGFRVDSVHGVHTVGSIGLSVAASCVEWLGRADLSDRLRFAARLRYSSDGRFHLFSTVVLLMASKG